MNRTWSVAHAYIIGVNNYQNLSPLHFCENDARKFEASIRGLIPGIKTTLVCGNEFTLKKYESIVMEISTLKKNNSTRDVLFFYYAGHGFASEGIDYLTCFDTELNREKIADTSIQTTKLMDVAFKSAISSVVMIFDACRSSGARSRSLGEQDFGISTAERSRRQGIISFFSCSPGEYSQELSTLKHGVFTSAMIEALSEVDLRTPINLNKSIVTRVEELVKQNDLFPQMPFTTVGPIEKANLDIISGYEHIITHAAKPKCLLIAGSAYSGKSEIGRLLAQKYNFGHYEMSSLAYRRYHDFKETSDYDGTIQDYLEKELWRGEDKDILANDLLKKYDGTTNVVITGPRLTEEIEVITNSNKWDVIQLYIHSDPRVQKERSSKSQKDKSFINDLSFEEFIRRDTSGTENPET